MSCHGSMLSEIKLQHIKDHLHGNTVLDVGAGLGHYSSWLFEQNNALNITALDLLDLEKTTGFTYYKMDLEQPLLLQDAQFSTVLAFDVIEHIAAEQPFLKELYRVCQSNGFLVGSVPHDKDEFLPAYNLTFKHRSDVTHKRYYTESSLEQALQSAGFSSVHIKPLGGINPQVIAEFFPRMVQAPLKKLIGLLRRVGVVSSKRLYSDLFFVAMKK